MTPSPLLLGQLLWRLLRLPLPQEAASPDAPPLPPTVAAPCHPSSLRAAWAPHDPAGVILQGVCCISTKSHGAYLTIDVPKRRPPRHGTAKPIKQPPRLAIRCSWQRLAALEWCILTIPVTLQDASAPRHQVHGGREEQQTMHTCSPSVAHGGTVKSRSSKPA